MTYKRLKSSNVEILNSIYNKVFKKFLFHSSYIFLCGSSVKQKDSFRRQINKKLPKLYSDIKIIYPENIFKDYLNTNKNKDMLNLETILAYNVDAICIIHESAGSFAELGAFTYNNKTEYFKRIIIITQEKYINKDSFINKGPIKRVKNKYKDHQIKYKKSDINNPRNKFCKELYLLIKNIKKSNKPSKVYSKRITNLVGLAYFILIYLHIKNDDSINLYSLKHDLNVFFKNNKLKNIYEGENVNDKIYYAAIHFLTEQEKYAKEIENNGIKITKSGEKEIRRLIEVTKEKVSNIQGNIDNIKLANLEQKLYN